MMRLQRVAVDGLEAIGKPAVPLLIKAIEHRNEYIRRRAIEALGRIGDPSAIDPLIQAMREQKDRNITVRALGEIGDPRAVEPIIQMGNTHWNGATVAQALAKIGDPRAVPYLIKMLKHDGWSARKNAVIALSKIEDRRAILPLIEILDDESRWVRQSVAIALGELGDKRAVKPLIEVLKDDSREDRWIVARSLGEIGDSRAITPLMQALHDKEVRSKALIALRQLGVSIETESSKKQPLLSAEVGQFIKENRESIDWDLVRASLAIPVRAEYYIRAWEDQSSILANKALREVMAETLSEMGDPAIEPLIQRLGAKDKYIRQGVAESLGAVGEKTEDPQKGRRIARHLWWRLTDTVDVADVAWEALARVVSRLTELQVAAPGATSWLFEPSDQSQ
jgi:HEAT repeat protein